MDLLLERATNEIDKRWVDGVRKAWKRLHAKRNSFRGRIDKSDVVDLAVLGKAGDAALQYLDEVQDFLERLRRDLLINKGMWTNKSHNRLGGGKPTPVQKAKEKVVDEIGKGLEAVQDARRRVEFFREGGHDRGKLSPQGSGVELRSFQGLINGINSNVEELMESADKAISQRLMRHLTKLVKEAEGKLDWGGHEPDEISLGKAKIVFLDTPARPRKVGAGRHPMQRKPYIEYLQAAQKALERKKLGHLWYGRFYIRPKDMAPQNPHGIHFGVGATYHRKGDHITIYSNPTRSLPRLIVHELGHRHYYKFMSNRIRHNFDRWFSQVEPTTKYGGSSPEEDFAEVFADYVLGKADLTRSQVDRLKAVLGGKRRLESLSDHLEDALVS